MSATTIWVHLAWSHPHAGEWGEVDADEQGRPETILGVVHVRLQDCPHGVLFCGATLQEAGLA